MLESDLNNRAEKLRRASKWFVVQSNVRFRLDEANGTDVRNRLKQVYFLLFYGRKVGG